MQVASASLKSTPSPALPFPVSMSFAGMSPTFRSVSGRTLRFQRGAEIYAEGKPAEQMYKVISGAIRTCRILPDGRRMIVQFAMPGDLFGLDGVSHHRFFAEAVTEAVVVAFPRREINEWVGREPGAAHSWNTYTLEKLAAAQDRFIMLGRRTASERVAAFLLDLADRGQRPDGSIDLPMSRYDIADYLGLTSETVSRILSNLRKNRTIAEQGCHRFLILDREALKEQADEEIA